MIEPRILQFSGVTVYLFGRFLLSVWPDDLTVGAAGSFDQESIQRARDLGYDSTWEMSRDHELLHSIIAEARGEPYSRVLRGVAVRFAGGRKEDIISPDASWQEECLVLSAQKYIQLGTVDSLLAESGLDIDALAARLREVTDA